MTIGADAKKVAQELHAARYIYHAYAVLDSLSSSYTMFKYFFDLLAPTTNATNLHDYILTPEGIAAIVAETLFQVGFSVLASYFDNQTDEQKKTQATYQKMLAEAWPYFRDLMKGLKNAYKGWRSLVLVVNLLSPASLSSLIIPLGVTLGILAAANRLMMREIVEKRKVMKKSHEITLRRLRRPEFIPNTDLVRIVENTGYQPEEEKYRGYISEVAGGIIDGLYNYMGVLILCALAPQALLILMSVCAAYTFITVITRVFQEYEYQQEIELLKTQCELNALGRKIKNEFKALTDIMDMEDERNIQELIPLETKNRLYEDTAKFTELHDKLLRQTSRSYKYAFLVGLKNGMFAYSALSSAIFAVTTILFLCSVPCPPLLLMITISMGVLFLLSFVIHAMVQHHFLVQQQVASIDDEYTQLLNSKSDCDEVEADWEIRNLNLNAAVNRGVAVPIPTKSPYADAFDVVRSFFSGLTKGQKFAEFAGSSLQDQDAHGQYRDSPILLGIVGASSLLFSVVLGLRFFARNFGKDDSQNDTSEEDVKEVAGGPEPNTQPEAAPEVQLIVDPEQQLVDPEHNVMLTEPIQPAGQAHIPSPPTIMTSLSARFFVYPPRAGMAPLLPNELQGEMEEEDPDANYIIQGLR